MSKTGGYTGPLEQVGPCQWRIPKSYRPDMRVDGLIFADETLIAQIKKDQGPEQVVERRHPARHPEGQPGDARHPLGLRVRHRRRRRDRPRARGRDLARGRRLRHQLRRPAAPLEPRMGRREGPDPAARRPALPRHPDRRRPVGQVQVRQAEAQAADGAGLGLRRRTRAGAPHRDLDFTEAGGRLDGADPDRVSDRAYARGYDQCGTLGSGNHFLEVQVVDRVIDETGRAGDGPARGADHRPDPLRARAGSAIRSATTTSASSRAPRRSTASTLPDPQLACAPVRSPEGQAYLGAMRAAANYAWCNRQLLTHQAREVFARVFGRPWEEPRHGPGLRRRAQHRQVRGPRRRRRLLQAGLRPPQGGHPRLPARPRRDPRRRTRRSASP